MSEPDRWCTATFDRLNADYPPFLRDRMKQDPSYGLAREILAQMCRESLESTDILGEYIRALDRVTELAESDRNELIRMYGSVFWGQVDPGQQPLLPRHFKWQHTPARPDYPRINFAMRNERPSYALALRLSGMDEAPTDTVNYPYQCATSVLHIEEHHRAKFRNRPK